MHFNSHLKENYDICFQTFMLWTTIIITSLLEVQPKKPTLPKICPAVLKMKHTGQTDAFQLCDHFTTYVKNKEH
jgi:hypothetical protein